MLTSVKNCGILVFFLLLFSVAQTQAQILDVYFELNDVEAKNNISHYEKHQTFQSKAELNQALAGLLKKLNQEGYLDARAREKKITIP